jgi:hypothetical protein
VISVVTGMNRGSGDTEKQLILVYPLEKKMRTYVMDKENKISTCRENGGKTF